MRGENSKGRKHSTHNTCPKNILLREHVMISKALTNIYSCYKIGASKLRDILSSFNHLTTITSIM